MSGHTNQDIQKHIDSDQTLLQNMNALVQEMENELMTGFQKDMGVPVPSVVEALVRELDYTMVYSSDPITDDYMNGAKDLLQAALAEDWSQVTLDALNVVGTVVKNVVGPTSIQTGVQAHSAKSKAPDGSTVFSAVRTDVRECAATDWATATNFYVSYYLFVVWEPAPAAMDTIGKAKPELAA